MIGIEIIRNHLEKVGYKHDYSGDEELVITGFSFPTDPKPSTILWIKNLEKNDIELFDDNIGLLIVLEERYQGKKNFNVISGKNPKGIFFSILDNFFYDEGEICMRGASAVETKDIGEDVSIGHNCTIEEGVVIGRGTRIKHNVVIQGKVIIGEDCFIDSGTVIGSGGFGYYRSPEGVPMKVPDFGKVIIGDRVRIGANTTVQQGTIGDTIIENDAKIGSLCNIGHNNQIGERSFVISGSILAGSVKVGKDVYIAPSTTIINQARIDDFAYIGMGAVVLNDVEAGKKVFGVPARVRGENKLYVSTR